MANLVGKNIGRYHVVEKLGEGGMAAVYKAYDTRLERDVAIKVITAAQQGSEQFLKRFEREAKALAKLTHANIVSVIDYGDEDGLPYLVMEYLPGGTLKQFIGKPIPFRDAACMLAPIAWALEYAHQRQIIHRDVKPANILLTESGTPMLSDFGIAKMLDVSGATQLTATGAGIGTPDYMSPEQSRGEAVDHRADIYSLGIVFYELVTGRRPFRADTPMAVIYKHATEPLPRPRQFVPELPQEVENVLFKALTKDPAERYQRMGDFADALENLTYLNGTVKPVSKAPSTGASGIKLTRETVTPAEERVTRTSPAVISQPSAEIPAAHPQAKKFPWAWAGIGMGVLVVLCIATALVAGFWKPISQMLGMAAVTSTSELPTVPTEPTAPKQTPQTEVKPTPDTDCAKKEVICVGAMGSGSWDDKSFHESVRIGLEQSAEKFGILPRYYEVPDFQQAADVVAKMADEKMDIIISVGFEYTDLMLTAAVQYPNIIFIGVDQIYPADQIAPNLVGITFHDDQAGFLAGVLAGMMTKTKSVGAVCGLDWIPPVWRYCEGFKAGVLYVIPDGHVEVAYHPGSIEQAFTDPVWGAETAKWMIAEKNADVIFSAAGKTGTGALKQAVELGVYVIGVDVDQYYSLPDLHSRMLSSAVKDISGSVFNLIELYITGKMPSGIYYGNVLLAPYHDLESEVPQDVKDKIERLTLKIQTGQLQTGVPESKDAQVIPTYRIATDPTWPPYEMIDDAGNLIGFDIELMKIISEKLQFQIQFVPVSFDLVLSGIANCEYDAAISAISLTPERRKLMLFSVPYFNDGQVILVHREENNILGRQDLNGRSVGVVAGSTAQAEAQSINGADVRLYDSENLLIQDLIEKGIDAAIVQFSKALSTVFKTKEALKIVGDILTEETYHVVVCKNKPELVDMVNKGLEILRADGSLDKLVRIWLVEYR